MSARILSVAVVVLVLGVLALALTLLGSPQRARTEALDGRRLSDLQQLAMTIGARYEHAPLPNTLPAGDGDQTLELRDPVRRRPYEYVRTAPNAFRLCARFDLPTAAYGDVPAAVSAWPRHGAGRACYAFDTQTVDRGAPSLVR